MNVGVRGRQRRRPCDGGSGTVSGGTRLTFLTRHGALGDRRFRVFFTTYTVSLFGTSMAGMALSFGVLDNHGSLADLGYVNAARIAPLVVFLIGGGLVGDRLPRRRVMLGADCARVAGQGGIALLFALGHAPLWALLCLAAVGGLSEAFFEPALNGLIPALAPKGRLREANGLLGLARSTTNVAGPALAGVLVTVAGAQTVLGIDSASYAVSVLGLLLLRLPASAVRPPASVVRQLREGWTTFRSHGWLWTVTVQFSFFNLVVWAPFLVLGPAAARDSYGGAGAWGAVMTGFGAGSLVGGLAALGRQPARPMAVAVAGTLLWAAPSAALWLRLPLGLVVLGAGLGGVASAVLNTLWATAVHQLVPEEAQSRISAYVSFGAFVFGPLGFAVAGPVAQTLGTGPVFGCGAVWQLVTASVVLALPAIRSVGRPPPEPAPDPTDGV